MRVNTLVCVIIIGFYITSCNNNDDIGCKYKLEQLLVNDTSKVVITYKNDSLLEVRDNTKSGSSGIYTFDDERNLRFYGFFVNENQYRYSEQYDSKGNLIQKEGTPLVEYRLWKKGSDTVLFNAFLFSLNKKYEGIVVVSNKSDTIRPNYLFNSDIYTNVKCFAFKLPVVKNINDIVLYTKGTVSSTCTNKKEFFVDTTSFKDIKF